MLTDNVYIQESSIKNSFVRERVFHHLNERFVSNGTGNIFFSTRSSEETSRRCVPKHNFSLKKKISQRDQCAIETLITIAWLRKEHFTV